MDIYQDRIRPLLILSKMNHRQLEKAIGLPPTSINKWESGTHKSYIRYVDRIARYFNLTTDYLLGNEEIKDNRILTEQERAENKKREFGLYLLHYWKSNNITKIYKYKNRIKVYKEKLTNNELFYDIRNEYFNELTDIASKNMFPVECAIDIDELIVNRTI